MNSELIRKVEINDYNKNHLELYKNLSVIEPQKISFNQYVKFIDNLNNNHNIFVIEYNNKIIASITLLIEYKLIHNFGKVCHIEDVVVSKEYQKQGLGKKLIEFAINFSKKNDCYKIILNCSNENISFYYKCGFKNKDNQLYIYL